jgi:hypothetical protein
MTCELFRQIIAKPVLDSTGAERTAVARHHEGCPACRDYLKCVTYEEHQRHGKPGLIDTVVMIAVAASLQAKDAQDPENRPTG